MNNRVTLLSLSASALIALTFAVPSRAGDFSSAQSVCANTGAMSNLFNINRSATINKNFDLSKKTIIEKNINVDVHAQAQAFAAAGARAGANVFAGGGDIGALAVQEPCVETWAQVVSFIHAECTDSRGQLHPAARMLRETWVDSSIEKELYRCLPGAALRVVIGEVVKCSHGMAGVYDNGKILICGPHGPLLVLPWLDIPGRARNNAGDWVDPDKWRGLFGQQRLRIKPSELFAFSATAQRSG